MDNFEVQGAGGVLVQRRLDRRFAAGPAPNQFNSFADFLLGYVSAGSRSILLDDRATSRTWQFSLFARDQWQASRKLTMSYGVRWDYFPMGVAKDRGFQKYDWENNKMILCGVGGVPRDCGVEVPHDNFSPRLGVAYRATDTFVIRGGYGINYDPQPLAFIRNLLGVYPQSLGYGAGRAAEHERAGRPPAPPGCRRNRVADLETGVIAIDPTTGFFSPPDEYEMGYIESFNVTFEKQMPWNLIGQAGYVGSRQRDILQTRGSQRRSDHRRRPRRAAAVPEVRHAPPDSNTIGNFGENRYDSLQATLTRGFANGMQINVAYTLVESDGPLLRRSERQEPGDSDPGVPASEQGAEGARSDARVHARDRCGAAVRRGQAVPELRRGREDSRRLAGECIVRLVQRHAVQRASAEHVSRTRRAIRSAPIR